MASENVKKRIKKMIAYCDEIIEKCEGKTISDLYNDDNFAEASCFVLGQIGEQVPGYIVSNDGKTIREADYDEFFSLHCDIKWNEVKGARNKIYHDYDGVDMSVIWETLQDIPNFKNKLINLLKL